MPISRICGPSSRPIRPDLDPIVTHRGTGYALREDGELLSANGVHMKLGLRIFACYLVIFCICFAYPVWWVLDSLRTRYLEGVEDPLVGPGPYPRRHGGADDGTGTVRRRARFYHTFASLYARSMDLQIYNLTKHAVDMGRLYYGCPGRGDLSQSRPVPGGVRTSVIGAMFI